MGKSGGVPAEYQNFWVLIGSCCCLIGYVVEWPQQITALRSLSIQIVGMAQLSSLSVNPT